MLSHDIPVDLLSLMLKEAVENEDGELEFATFHIIDFLLVLLILSIETTPKAIALVMKRLSENPHTIKELRVSTVKFESLFYTTTNLKTY